MGRRCTALHAAPRTGFTLRLSSFSLQRKRSTHEDQSFFALSNHLQPEEKAAQTTSGGRKLRGDQRWREAAGTQDDASRTCPREAGATDDDL